MKARKIFALSTLFAGLLNAGSIWNYTFTDYFCQSCAPVGFSFSRPAPIEIELGRDLWIPGSEFTSCDTINPALYCYGADLSWRSPGVLQVNFSRQFTYQADWELPVEARYAVPALSTEGVYTTELRFNDVVETQIFSIIDPPVADTPEPSSFWLLLVGVPLIAIRNWRRSVPSF